MKTTRTFSALLIAAACATVSAADAPATIVNGAMVAANGMTLYTFDADPANSGKSVCNGPCAALWPPLTATAGEPTAGAYSVIVRDDGSRQLAFKGKPLYFYKGDQKAGDRTGDNFKNVWHLVKE